MPALTYLFAPASRSIEFIRYTTRDLQEAALWIWNLFRHLRERLETDFRELDGKEMAG